MLSMIVIRIQNIHRVKLDIGDDIEARGLARMRERLLQTCRANHFRGGRLTNSANSANGANMTTRQDASLLSSNGQCVWVKINRHSYLCFSIYPEMLKSTKEIAIVGKLD